MSHRYYSPLRPLSLGTFPKPQGNEILHIENFEEPQEVYDGYLQITGYCKCCVDCDFIEEKDADELMHLAAYLAGNEQARAEAQQKAGKKA